MNEYKSLTKPEGRRFKDISGAVFGRLTTISFAGVKARLGSYWTCRCQCGVVKDIRARNLLDGTTLSCGCLRSENLSSKLIKRKRRLIHGHTYKGGASKEYYSWQSMIQRCLNPTSTGYKYWGGRGITVCARWTKFDNFLEDMGERPSLLHSLDRINNDGNYDPSNCRWATKKEQANNRKQRTKIINNNKGDNHV